MSKNNIFYDFEESVYCRYKKTVPTMVSGTRRNPYKPEESIAFVLATDSRNFNFDRIGKNEPLGEQITFNYDDEVLEVYTEQEDKFIRRVNAHFFREGILIAYEENRPVIETTNDISDTDIYEIASAKNVFQFKKALQAFDSAITLNRIKEALRQKNRPISFVNAVTSRLEEIDSKESTTGMKFEKVTYNN